LAQALAANVHGGETIELSSDLGGGKTTFTRFFGQALGAKDDISSPSFTVQNIYRLDEGELHHFDFYRLDDAGIVAGSLEESIYESDILTVIEWANIVEGVLPVDTLRIAIRSNGGESRLYEFTATPENSYLLEGLSL